MKMIFATLATVSLLWNAPQALAQESKLASPQVLLEKAARNQQELIDVINTMMYNYGDIQTGVEFDRYFELLSPLSNLATQFHLEEIYPGAISGLGSKMTQFGVRWLDILKDPTTKILSYHRWASAEAALAFLERADSQIKGAPTDQELRQVRETLLALQAWADSTFPSNTLLLNTYRDLNSKLAIRYLAMGSLTPEERERWLSAMQTEAMVWEYAQILRARIMTKPADRAQALTAGVFELRYLLKTLSVRAEISRSLITYLQDLLIDAVMRSFDTEVVLDVPALSSTLTVLSERHLQALALQLMAPRKNPSRQLMKSILDFSDLLLESLRQQGLRLDADRFSQYLERQSGNFYAYLLGIEGTYDLRDQTGHEWKMTVLRTQENEYRAALGDQKSGAFITSTTLLYDRKFKRFLALEREADTSYTANPALFFQVDPKGKIELYYPHGRAEIRDMKGTRSQVYPDYFSSKFKPHADYIEGEFEGKMPIPGGNEIPVRLTIIPAGLRTYGRLQSLVGAFDIALQLGTDGGEGSIYLTSGMLPSHTFSQIRAYMAHGKLYGYYVIAGKGIAAKEFELKKVRSFVDQKTPRNH